MLETRFYREKKKKSLTCKRALWTLSDLIIFLLKIFLSVPVVYKCTLQMYTTEVLCYFHKKKKKVSVLFYPIWNIFLPLSYTNALWEYPRGKFQGTNLRACSFPLWSHQSSHKKAFTNVFFYLFYFPHSLIGFSFLYILYVVTFMNGCSIFLSPPSLRFTLCRCREYIPCYQP